MYSMDGKNWFGGVVMPNGNDWCGLAASSIIVSVATVNIPFPLPGQVATGGSNILQILPPPSLWDLQSSPGTNAWRAVAYSPQQNIFMAVAGSGTGDRAMSSPDGINWTLLPTPQDNFWCAIAWSPELSMFCAISNEGVQQVMSFQY
jgi:hypothetical protein